MQPRSRVEVLPMSGHDGGLRPPHASSASPGHPPLELWLGAECSVVRVGDDWIDQNQLTGHALRLDDIDRMAAVGARAIRLPVLWERTWPDAGVEPDWSFADSRLQRMRGLGVRPIVGFVHHGSGPACTDLLQASFVDGLAAFARRFAERFPWVEAFTPVNEPLTTARFSGLYGHWYPHARSAPDFVQALLVQCEAVAASMRAIRTITPAARLVQTEDMGTVFSTPELGYQAMFENHRRFMSLDLLMGRIDPAHPMHVYLTGNGAARARLDAFVARPCVPDVVGLNHYVTSDRFLDDRLGHYPPSLHGGNGRHAYVDVEAVRVLGTGLPGHAALLGQVWERYRRPLALTEVHLGCAIEEQLRWLLEAWNGAEAARAAGADVRAVTAWAAFGACDWDSLLVQSRGRYEPGLFDVRGGHVRPTGLATVASELAATGTSAHPLAPDAGWWRRGIRMEYPSHGPVQRPRRATGGRPVLVTGARGTLGVALARRCEARGLRAVLLSRSQLDLCDTDAIAAALEGHRPWAVVNAAGYVRVDAAEDDAATCMAVNADAPARLAAACAARGIRLAVMSTDLVFDGTKAGAYVEDDAAAPLSVYGASKARMEQVVLSCHPGAIVARTSAFFGPWDQANFVFAALSALQAGMPFHAATDAVVTPTYTPDVADALLTLLVDGADGIWHLANRGETSWHDLARRAARAAGIDDGGLVGCSQANLDLRATRPLYSALASGRGGLMPDLDDALQRYLHAVPWQHASEQRRA